MYGIRSYIGRIHFIKKSSRSRNVSIMAQSKWMTWNSSDAQQCRQKLELKVANDSNCIFRPDIQRRVINTEHNCSADCNHAWKFKLIVLDSKCYMHAIGLFRSFLCTSQAVFTVLLEVMGTMLAWDRNLQSVVAVMPHQVDVIWLFVLQFLVEAWFPKYFILALRLNVAELLPDQCLLF